MNSILQCHVLDILKTLPDDSVDCVVTSPPYWGLRDYKIEPQIWDAVEGTRCFIERTEHEWGEGLPEHHPGQVNQTKWQDCDAVKDGQRAGSGSFCLRCGAWRGSLGLEPTPELFVKHIVQVFREVRRVMKPTGVCFVNLGDSYASGKGTCFNPGGGSSSLGQDRKAEGVHPLNRGNKSTLEVSGLKPKDLVGVPWRVAFALQADGWWLRSDIIWSKPNPMPESVTDRPTKSHEYIFLLTKSARYFWNAEAVREPGPTYTRKAGGYKGFESTHIGNCQKGGLADRNTTTIGRNIRSVWTFATEPTPEAHFATFPQELVRRCILAGCPDDGTVLDPFFGSGTTGIVAENLYRKWIGIELNPEYIEIAEKRLRTKANIDQVNWLKEAENAHRP